MLKTTQARLRRKKTTIYLPLFYLSLVLSIILSPSLLSFFLPLSQLVTTLQGSPLRFNIYPGDVHTAQCSPISSTVDLEATNGVIHVLDKVMTPPQGHIIDMVAR